MSNIHKGDYAVIQVRRWDDARHRVRVILSWKNSDSLVYTKYHIKEEDWRVKTASFTSPVHLDLTTGQYAVRIVSKYHENFAGIILDVDYDEDTHLYTYQCQDFSRMYMSKFESIVRNAQVYKLLMHFLSQGEIPVKDKMSRKNYEHLLSGLRSIDSYDQSLYPGNIYKGNPFKKNDSFIARDKSFIEVIRNIVFYSLGFFDVWFNDRGVLQIEPLSKTDWENTGLHLTGGYTSRKFKFSTTNAITGVVVNGTDDNAGKRVLSTDFQDLDLTAFFGRIGTSISNPVKQSSTKSTSNAVKSNNTTVVNKNNPYGTKNKEVWVNMDEAGNGSADHNYINKVCELLRKNGWKVHNMGVGANIHTLPQYFNQCKNGIWLTIDNGMDPGTIRHLGYDSWCAGSIMKKGGRCVFACMMDNTKKYWIEKGCGNWYDLHEAHDDRYSAGDTYLKYPAGYMAWCGLPFMTAKNYDASGMVAQFLKGGVSQEALKMSNWKNRKGNYYIRSGWSSKY